MEFLRRWMQAKEELMWAGSKVWVNWQMFLFFFKNLLEFYPLLLCFHRYGGWSWPPVPSKRGRPPQGPLPVLEEDPLLQTPGGLQDHVARIEEIHQVKPDLWVLSHHPRSMCVRPIRVLAHICLVLWCTRLPPLHYLFHNYYLTTKTVFDTFPWVRWIFTSQIIRVEHWEL